MQKRFEVPVYNFNVYVTDLEHVVQLEEMALEGKGLGGVVYWYKGKLCVYIATDNKKRIGEFLAHESVHCAFEILKSVGVKIDEGNNEAYTYLHEYLLKNALIEKDYKKV